jgi:transcriptional regulator
MVKRPSPLHGTLDTLVLRVLSDGPRHGYAIARRLEDAGLEVEEGSLYPALYRMEKRGLLRAEWGTSELDRRAKFYHLTRRGRTALQKDQASLLRFTRSLRQILEPAPAPGGKD